jgi:hypothetical protein
MTFWHWVYVFMYAVILIGLVATPFMVWRDGGGD